MTMKCECIDESIKRHIERALIHSIRDIQGDVAEFAKAAQEYKTKDPKLSKHFSSFIEFSNAEIEEIQAAKDVIKALPICETGSGNPHNPGRLLPEERHQLKIAKDTLKMSDAMAGVMGGPTKEEAKEIIKRLEGKK